MKIPKAMPRPRIAEEMKDKEARLLQLGNIIMGCLRALPVLVGYSASMAVVGIGTDIMTMTASDFTFEALQFMLWMYAVAGGLIGVVHCWLFNTGRYRNVYYHRT